MYKEWLDSWTFSPICPSTPLTQQNTGGLFSAGVKPLDLGIAGSGTVQKVGDKMKGYILNTVKLQWPSVYYVC